MEKHITKYAVNDLLQNDSFLRWRILSSDEDRLLWESYLKDTPSIKSNIDEAIRIINSLQYNNYTLSKKESLDMFHSIQKRIEKNERMKKHRLYAYISTSIACILLLLISHPLFFQEERNKLFEHHESINSPENNRDIQLIIGDNDRVLLEQDAEIRCNNGVVVVDGNKTKETFLSGKTETYLNKLIIPKGKRSSLVLEDGTKIWINSGSTIEFPNSFAADQRSITVIGEVYLEVVSDSMRPFVVKTSDLLVEVLGTSFNISCYQDDPSSQVVLVKGSVQILSENKKTLLYPAQMASVCDQNIQVKTVNIQDYISWKDGLLQFNSEPLFQILKRLSRYYAMHFECDKQIENMKCTGKLVLFDDIDKVLQTITHTIPVNYELRSEHEIYISAKNKHIRTI